MEKLSKGSSITAENGKVYIIDEVISVGTGQGDVYKVYGDNGSFALKLFHSGNPRKLLSQIELLIKRGKICESFVYPIDIVRFENKVGYTMEYVGSEYVDSSVLYNGVYNHQNKLVELPYNQKLALLYAIASALKLINDANLSIYDVKFDNIKVNLSDNTIRILDTDTIIYNKSSATVFGTVGFMPPKTMRGEKPDRYNDCYAMAVIIFMTLLGSHPLIGKMSEQPCRTNIEQFLFETNPLYIFDRNNWKNRPIAADGIKLNQQRTIDRMKKYPSYFADCMHKTFSEGLFDGEKRTSFEEWLEILERLYADSYVCVNCGEELFYNSFSKKCAVCGAEIEAPLRIVCGSRTIPLFNGSKIFSGDLWTCADNYEVFSVVVSQYDKKFGLLCLSAKPVTLELKNGFKRTFMQNEVIPIFLDGTITIENNTIKFII